MRNPVSVVLIAPIRGYQKYISAGLPRTCRYYPTCSSYAVDAITVHGPIKGLMLAIWRILRCNPWSRGGVDHVPAQGKWKRPVWIPPEDWVGHDIEEKPSVVAGIRQRLRRQDKRGKIDGSTPQTRTVGEVPSKVKSEEGMTWDRPLPGNNKES